MSKNADSQLQDQSSNQTDMASDSSSQIVPSQSHSTSKWLPEVPTDFPIKELHSFRVFGSRFVIDSCYKPLRGLGRGAYGIVISADDLRTNSRVAIKKIPRMFQDLVDAKRILREIKLLNYFDHPNIIKLHDIAPSYGEFEEIYMVLDFMESDLHRIIYSSNQISLDHIRYITYQILSGLKHMHASNVIHRDLKPSNLLINSNSDVKICDFGLARGFQEHDYLTEYVVTRWYRAPEIMTSTDAYGFAIDIWSLGCIVAELVNRQPLFPGDDYKKQLHYIFNALGSPSPTDCEFITNDFALQYIRSLPARSPTPIEQLVKTTDPQCLDLVSKMLKFNPKERISVDEALTHPFLKPFYDTNSCHAVPDPAPWDTTFELFLQDHSLTKLAIQQYMLREVFQRHPEYILTHGKRYGLLNEEGKLVPEPVADKPSHPRVSDKAFDHAATAAHPHHLQHSSDTGDQHTSKPA